MLLTKEEIKAIKDNTIVAERYGYERAIEAAILEKLASAELPANAPHITRRIRACESEVPALIVFEHAWRQAYAQGAAAQLDRLKAAEKDAERYRFALDDREFAVCEFNNNRRRWVPIRDNASIDKAMEASK